MATVAQPSHPDPLAPQPIQQPEERELTLKEGYIQPCQGYIERKTTILKRWEKELLCVIPGM